MTTPRCFAGYAASFWRRPTGQTRAVIGSNGRRRFAASALLTGGCRSFGGLFRLCGCLGGCLGLGGLFRLDRGLRLGSGGFLGRGYGSGLQKLFFLPEPHTDFIFAITGEELGLVGLMVLLGLAGVIVWRGFVIALRLEDPQRALLAFGITTAFAMQSLVHMVVCLDLLPPKGIPLPLVSYGKTEMLVTLVSVGILLNLSREVKA